MSSYFGNIGSAVSSLWDGMRVTLHHLAAKKRLNATLQYPHERWPIPDRHIGFDHAEYNVIRSRLHVDIDDCIGCLQCERVCPVDCIKIDTLKVPKETELGAVPGATQTSATSNGTAKRLLVSRFDIDMAECMYGPSGPFYRRTQGRVSAGQNRQSPAGPARSNPANPRHRPP